MHADDAVLLAYLDGELDDIRRAALARHLAECAACAATLDELRGAAGGLAAALAAADTPAPTEPALREVTRRRPAARGLRDARRAVVRAAALVLGLAGAAAAAVPGSPVRRWIERAVSPPAPVVAPAPAPPVRPAPAPVAEAPAAGVSLPAGEARVRVVIRGAGPALRVRTRVSSGSSVEVSASGAAARARFRTGPGRVEVVGAEAGEVLVTIPAGTADAVVEVDGTVVLAREDGVLRFPGPAPDSTADGLVFRPRR